MPFGVDLGRILEGFWKDWGGSKEDFGGIMLHWICLEKIKLTQYLGQYKQQNVNKFS